MTCIVAIGDGKNVWMGADAVRHNDNEQCVRMDDPKIYKKSKLLVGVSGSHVMSQFINRVWDPPVEIFDNKDNAGVMWRVRSHLWDFLVANGQSVSNADKNTLIKGEVMFGFRGEVWAMDAEGGIGTLTSNYYAIGAGDELALGSLYTTNDIAFVNKVCDDPKRRVELALASASYHLSAIQGPWLILSN